MNVTVRRARVPQDYAGIARVLNAESPEWPTAPEDLASEAEARDPLLPWIMLVAEAGGTLPSRLVGVGTLGYDPLAHRPGKLKLDLRVPPDLQGRGIGAKLYQALMAAAQPLHPRELQTNVWETLTRAIKFVTDRGFRETWRRIDSHLAVSQFEAGPYAGLEANVRAVGLEIKTYAALEPDPGRLEKLYELDWSLWQDIPYGEPPTKRSLERFAKEEVLKPDFIPEACFIAVQGNEFVGYSNLTGHGDYYENEMTGVRGGYRGRGVATLLKLYGIRYAQSHGGFEIRTTNDSVNTPILALNAKLGFVRDGATIRFLKRLEAG